MRNCIGNSPHGSKKFVSFTSSSPLNAMSTWGGSVETRKWATWPRFGVGSQSQPSKLQGFCHRILDIEVFSHIDMFPCQKGFRHATGIGKYGWLIMVICLVHSFLLFSIWFFFHLFVSFLFYSQTILRLSVDGLARTEDCEFEESLLGATWEFFV